MDNKSLKGIVQLEAPDLEERSGGKVSKNSSVDQGNMHGKDITQMTREDLEAHFLSSGAEFSSKMEENFKNYVFIAPSKKVESLDTAVEMMTCFDGYKMHRAVGCSQRIYHLYVKYEAPYIAIAARDLFRSKHYHAEIVDDMLRLWYAFETGSGQAVPPTTAWLAHANGKYLTSKSAAEVLRKYGNPEIHAVMEKSFKVNFKSLAEAFGACISLGPWFYNNMLKDSNYHSLKIVLSSHSSKIIRLCNMTSVAREFDYFAQNDPVQLKTKVSSISDKVELNQPIKTIVDGEMQKPGEVYLSCVDKQPLRIGQKNRNGGRIFKKNFRNIQSSHSRNKPKVFQVIH